MNEAVLVIGELVRGLFVNTCILVTAAWLASNLIARLTPERGGLVARLLSIGLPSLLGIILMQFPVALGDGLIFDLRNVSILSSAFHGGPGLGLPVAALVATYRYFMGGTGAIAGITGALVCGLLGSLLWRPTREAQSLGSILVRSLFIYGIAAFTILLVPTTGLISFRLVFIPHVLFQSAGTLLISKILLARLAELRHEQDIRQLAETDHLTGLLNARTLDQVLSTRGGKAQGYLLLLDLDHFKRVNDTYGHAVGDEVLRRSAQAMRQAVRSQDWLFRYGGEEFVILMETCDLPTALAVANRVRGRVAESEITLADGRKVRVTLSGGLVELRAGGSTAAAMERADQLLYMAKQAGRNQICHDEAAAQATNS